MRDSVVFHMFLIANSSRMITPEYRWTTPAAVHISIGCTYRNLYFYLQLQTQQVELKENVESKNNYENKFKCSFYYPIWVLLFLPLLLLDDNTCKEMTSRATKLNPSRPLWTRMLTKSGTVFWDGGCTYLEGNRKGKSLSKAAIT